MGWLGAIGSIFSWLGGDSILATVSRLAIGLGIAKLINRSNESSTSSSTSTTPQGTRQQIPAATDNKIPVAYGDSYFSGTVTDIYSINSNKELFAVLTLCEVTGDIFSSNPTAPGSRIASSITIDDIYINNQRVTFKADGTTIAYTTDDTGVQDTNLDGLVGIYLYKGNSNYPMLPCVTGTTTPISGTLPPPAYEIIPDWDNTYLNQNTIFALVKLNYDPSKGAHSVPSIKFHVRNTMNKPGDCIHDYMTNQMYGMRMSESMVDGDTITALNEFSDELITLGTYPAQSRYRINGLVRTSESVLNNCEKLAAAAGSVLSYDISQGKWSIVINKSGTMSRQFDDSNIIGAVKPSVANLDSFYNAVEVQFPYKVLKDQYNYVRFDLPEIYQNANEQKNVMQITHEFVNDVVQATVLANLDLRQSRENLSVTFKTDFSQYGTAIGEIIGVSSDVYGWTDKLFKVIKIKRVETDDGQLTLEITGQSYNDDVYTVEEITDFVPLIGVGHSLPSITPIATPSAPLVSSTTLSSQPAVFITGTVPTGIVTEMEYWYTSSTDPDDNARPYTLLGTMRSENGGPFDTGVTSTFKTVLLATATYRFKVRAANMSASSTSKFSPPSDPLAYTYTQAPDVLKYTTPTVDDSGVDAASVGGGLSIGLLGAYLATKLNWFGENGIFSGNATMEGIFGISSNQANMVTNSVASDKAGALSAEQIQQIAQQTAANTATSVTTTILSQVPPTGNLLETKTSTIEGHVFPDIFGSGPKHGEVDSRAGIFTHDHLVFGPSSAASVLKSNNIVKNATTLTANVQGIQHHFYNFPSLASGNWSQKPFFNEALTDIFAADTKTTLYYAEGTYTSGNLDAVSWSNWKRVASSNGVTGERGPKTETKVIYTNPEPEVTFDYIVEEQQQTDGAGELYLGPRNINYDPFKPNVAKTISTTVMVDTLEKTRVMDFSGVVPFDGSKLIMFGVSTMNIPDNTPVAKNTVFGHVDKEYVNTYPKASFFNLIANNGSMFVGIDKDNSKVSWSVDGDEWMPAYFNSDTLSENASWINTTTNHSDPDNQVLDPFRFVVYDGSKFIIYGTGNNVATSTDGKIWTEPSSSNGLHHTITDVTATGGHYLAVGKDGIQTSSDGVTWSAISMPAAFATIPKCCAWMGSKFIVGMTKDFNTDGTSIGAAIMSSTNGTTWAEEVGTDNVKSNSKLSNANNASVLAGLKWQNTCQMGDALN